MHKLGEVQKTVLKSLTKSRVWNPGCGWVYGTPSETKRVLDSLVCLGLATCVGKVYTLVAGV